MLEAKTIREIQAEIIEKLVDKVTEIQTINDRYIDELVEKNNIIRSLNKQIKQKDNLLNKYQDEVHIKGGRNIGLTSLAGQLKIAGWDKQATSLELHRANEVACKPPLRKDEVNTIIRSVYKYEN
jgi:FtsZ-binding cell division protein ZapB